MFSVAQNTEKPPHRRTCSSTLDSAAWQRFRQAEQAECREPLGGWPAVLSGFDLISVFKVLDLRFAVPDSGRSADLPLVICRVEASDRPAA